MELFGDNTLYRSNTQEDLDWKNSMEEGDKVCDEIERKLLANEHITEEEVKEAEKVLDEIAKKIHKDVSEACTHATISIQDGPSELVPFFVLDLMNHIRPCYGTLDSKRTILVLVNKKYKYGKYKQKDKENEE